MTAEISFGRLSDVSLQDILEHMSNPKIAEHMPLLTFEWDINAARKFVATKERCWDRDGLGRWAILANGAYVGWGGFQKEGDEWDFGLVLRPDSFGLGLRIAKKALSFARLDNRTPYVTFLLPLTRVNLGAFDRLGAIREGEVSYEGVAFQKFRLDTN
jgi:hypothetical protein